MEFIVEEVPGSIFTNPLFIIVAKDDDGNIKEFSEFFSSYHTANVIARAFSDNQIALGKMWYIRHKTS